MYSRNTENSLAQRTIYFEQFSEKKQRHGPAQDFPYDCAILLVSSRITPSSTPFRLYNDFSTETID